MSKVHAKGRGREGLQNGRSVALSILACARPQTGGAHGPLLASGGRPQGHANERLAKEVQVSAPDPHSRRSAVQRVCSK